VLTAGLGTACTAPSPAQAQGRRNPCCPGRSGKDGVPPAPPAWTVERGEDAEAVLCPTPGAQPRLQALVGDERGVAVGGWNVLGKVEGRRSTSEQTASTLGAVDPGRECLGMQFVRGDLVDRTAPRLCHSPRAASGVGEHPGAAAATSLTGSAAAGSSNGLVVVRADRQRPGVGAARRCRARSPGRPPGLRPAVAIPGATRTCWLGSRSGGAARRRVPPPARPPRRGGSRPGPSGAVSRLTLRKLGEDGGKGQPRRRDGRWQATVALSLTRSPAGVVDVLGH
jgi:hypothetical protein